MDHISRVLQLTDYIEANLPNVLSVGQLSDWLGVSKWHLQREFKEITGHSIGQYSTGRRLSLAAQSLAKDNYRILDVALNFGFESQEAFARAFKRHFKISPKNLKGQQSWADNIKFQPLTQGYLECYQELKNIEPKLVKFDNMQLVALPRAYITIRHDEAEFNQALQAHWNDFNDIMSQRFPDVTLPHEQCFSVEFSNHCSYATGEFLMMCAACINGPIAHLSVDHSSTESDLIYFNLAAKSYFCFELASHDWVAPFLRYLCEHYLPEQKLALVDFPVLWQGTESGGVKCFLPLSPDKALTSAPSALQGTPQLVAFTPPLVCLKRQQAPLSCHNLSQRLCYFVEQFPELVCDDKSDVQPALMIGDLQARKFNIEHEFHGALATPVASADMNSVQLPEADYLSCQLRGSLTAIGEAMEYVYHYFLWDSPFYQVQGIEWLTDMTCLPNGEYCCQWRVPVKHRSGKKLR
ncbi:helix-turn-helix domain-containing protein [Motilimonas eburnea]|uniref:helix-turn-helix domain-containing protein n=1 Tax=Motilimonas eburnea TaxID=1737488 RepID=UPI001E5F470B|nr:AraC family transcriptional regulator [Motilimonas eburnea]MCE2569864.1 AraC family transcriptional regulator [Motilimonas eburnea]